MLGSLLHFHGTKERLSIFPAKRKYFAVSMHFFQRFQYFQAMEFIERIHSENACHLLYRVYHEWCVHLNVRRVHKTSFPDLSSQNTASTLVVDPPITRFVCWHDSHHSFPQNNIYHSIFPSRPVFFYKGTNTLGPPSIKAIWFIEMKILNKH